MTTFRLLMDAHGWAEYREEPKFSGSRHGTGISAYYSAFGRRIDPYIMHSNGDGDSMESFRNCDSVKPGLLDLNHELARLAE